MRREAVEPVGRSETRRFYQAVVLALVMLASLALYLTVLWWRGPAAPAVSRRSWRSSRATLRRAARVPTPAPGRRQAAPPEERVLLPIQASG